MIRLAEKKDIDGIAQIYANIHRQEELGMCTTGWIRDVYPTRATAEASLWRHELFVMEEEGSIVASMRLNREQDKAYDDVRWTYEADAQHVMVMHTLVVEPACARRGYGTQMEAFYEAYALEHDCTVLRIDTNSRNLRARSMYARLGYGEAGIVPCVFNGISGVRLVCMEKCIETDSK